MEPCTLNIPRLTCRPPSSCTLMLMYRRFLVDVHSSKVKPKRLPCSFFFVTSQVTVARIFRPCCITSCLMLSGEFGNFEKPIDSRALRKSFEVTKTRNGKPSQAVIRLKNCWQGLLTIFQQKFLHLPSTATEFSVWLGTTYTVLIYRSSP